MAQSAPPFIKKTLKALRTPETQHITLQWDTIQCLLSDYTGDTASKQWRILHVGVSAQHGPRGLIVTDKDWQCIFPTILFCSLVSSVKRCDVTEVWGGGEGKGGVRSKLRPPCSGVLYTHVSLHTPHPPMYTPPPMPPLLPASTEHAPEWLADRQTNTIWIYIAILMDF